MEQVADGDSYLIRRALQQVGVLENAEAHHAAGDNDALGEIFAKALYESIRIIRHQNQLATADELGMRAILYARFPNELKELIEADKANGWKPADWAEKWLLLARPDPIHFARTSLGQPERRSS
jgi:hypothetical protein